MKTLLSKLSLVACVAIISWTSSPLQAQTQAYTAAPLTTENDLGGYGMSGIEFTLNENINVTSLGFTALSLGGDTPQVTLWQVGGGGALTQIYTTGNIIGSVTSYPQGTDQGIPSFVSVGTPLALSSGDTYLVTAPAYWASTFPSSSVSVASGPFSSTSFLTTNPTNVNDWQGWANSAYLGGSPNLSSFSLASSSTIPTEANFQFTTSASSVPEPSTYAMLGTSLALLALIARRRRA